MAPCTLSRGPFLLLLLLPAATPSSLSSMFFVDVFVVVRVFAVGVLGP
jgi:hypothetical protein